MSTIFITGATGYVGGSVGARLARQGADVLGLVRSQEKERRLRDFGMEPLAGSLDDTELLTHAASRADAVIDAADMYHGASTRALIDGLAGSGKPLLHVSGTSVVADRGTGDAGGTIFDEDTPIVPLPEKAGIHEIDRFVIEAATRGVRSSVLCLSAIYGAGNGPKPLSKKVPFLVRKARECEAGVYIERGENIWSSVHIDDTIDLFTLALERAAPGSFFFGESGESSYRDLAGAISRGLGYAGRTVSWPLDDAIREVGHMHAVFALASNVRVRGKRARAGLGWSPRHTDVRADVETELRNERGMTA